MADINKVPSNEQPIKIQSEIDAVNSARLGSAVRSSIANALKKIADSFNTVVDGYNTAASNYNSISASAQQAAEQLDQFNTIDVSVDFIGADGSTVDKSAIPGYSNAVESGKLERYTNSSAFKFKFPYLKGDKGDNGKSAYLHIKFSQDSKDPSKTGGEMVNSPTALTEWVGFLTSASATAPTTSTSYNWVRIKGETGAAGKDGTDSAGLVSQRLKATKVWWLKSNNPNLAKNGFVEESSYVSRNADLVKNSDLAAVVFQKSSYGSYVDKKGDHTILNLSDTKKNIYEGKNNTDYDVKVVVFIRKGETVTASITDRKGNRFSREVSWLTSALKRVDNASKTWTFQNAFYFSNAWMGAIDKKNGNIDVYTCTAKDITKNRNTNKNWNQFMIPIAIYVFEGSNATQVDSDT